VGREKYCLCEQLAQKEKEIVKIRSRFERKIFICRKDSIIRANEANFMSKWLIGICAVWGIGFTSLLSIAIFSDGEPVSRAIIMMTLGLVIFWTVSAGLFMYFFREPIRRFVLSIPLQWQVKFVLFCILLAMLEEAITTRMTNLAPFFGVAYGEAYITASGDYWDVVLFHSVIVFVPMFIAWAWLLSRYRFSPSAAFLCFGLTGVLAESVSFGLHNLINLGFWVFVYGLMIYLPVYCLPEKRNAIEPRWWHYPLAVLFPILVAVIFIIGMGIVKSALGMPPHPDIHFEGIQ
jgi:hypothetical protein